MTTFFSILRTDKSESFGKCLGCHKTLRAAEKTQDKVLLRNQDAIIVECDTKFVVGDFYVEEAQKAFDEYELSQKRKVMIHILDERSGVAKFYNKTWVVAMLAGYGMSIDEFEVLYGEDARKIIAEREEEERKAAEIHARRTAAYQDLEESTTKGFNLTFPAVSGRQGLRQYYTAQIPYGALIKLFKSDEEDIVPAELRAQRELNETRATKIGNYIIDNIGDYVLPAITASVDTAMEFEVISGSLGMLHIPIDAIMLINDGQHRRKGIEEAVAKNNCLLKETIAVTIYFDQGLKRSQQIFADINQNQVKPSSAITMTYNHRDEFSNWIISLLDDMPRIKQRVDMERSSISAKSSKLWSIIAFKKFVERMFNINDRWFKDTEEDKKGLKIKADALKMFFDRLEDDLPNWKAMLDFNISAPEIRSQFVIGHAVFLEALGIMGNKMLQNDPQLKNEFSEMKSLTKINVSRTHDTWNNRCVLFGKMNKTADGVKSTGAALCIATGLDLCPELRMTNDRILRAA